MAHARSHRSCIVPNTITIAPDRITIDAQSLSEIDILMATVTPNPPVPFTPEEASAIREFVAAGGTLLFYGDIGSFGWNVGSNSLGILFGITYDEVNKDLEPGVVWNAAFHAIHVGPFGTSDVTFAATGGILSQTDGVVVASLGSGPMMGQAAIVAQDPSTGLAGAGRAVWFTDVNLVNDIAGTFGFNEILWLNTIAYASDKTGPVSVEASTWGGVKALYRE
jgi:hypothetical protein